MERRLAAILAADVVGYSRLMEIDEAGTLEALKWRRRQILAPLVADHHGRIVKLMGDGVLIEFASAVNAVCCAIELQKQMGEANAGAAQDRAIRLRVGLNLGDVLVEGGDLYGDGVNIAARLQARAEPDGIWLTRTVVDHVRNKLALRFDDLGEQQMRNITAPVHVYRVAETASATSATEPVPPSRPSVAVLPFTNLSGDPEQHYFSDGITEDILTELSRFRQLFVIARNSSFQYRNQAIDVRRIARELGVRFIVEGSVRKSEDRLRVAVQLIEADTGHHIWAERFDREPKDVFAVQDEITQTIVSSLAGRIEDADRRRALRKDTGDLSAYDLFLRGKHSLEKGSQRDILEARAVFQRIVDRDPAYAPGYVELAETYFYEVMSGWSADPAAAAERLFDLAQVAARLDDQDSRAHLALAWGYWQVKANFDMAKAQIDEAIALNPNDLDNYCLKGWISTCAGDLEEGIWCTGQAIRRAPNLPEKCLHSRVMAEFLLGRFADAIATFGRMLQPPVALFGWIAACYAELGRADDARAAAAEFRERVRAHGAVPAEDDLEGWRAFWSKSFPAKERTNVERLFAGLRKAGLPA